MILPFMPERRRFGRRRSIKLRAVVEALFYIASTGCQCVSCQGTFRHTQPCKAIFMRGFWMDVGS